MDQNNKGGQWLHPFVVTHFVQLKTPLRLVQHAGALFIDHIAIAAINFRL